MAEEIVRVIRVLEYVGPRWHVESTLEANKVKRTKRFGKTVVREAIVGDFPETLEQTND